MITQTIDNWCMKCGGITKQRFMHRTAICTRYGRVSATRCECEGCHRQTLIMGRWEDLVTRSTPDKPEYDRPDLEMVVASLRLYCRHCLGAIANGVCVNCGRDSRTHTCPTCWEQD